MLGSVDWYVPTFRDNMSGLSSRVKQSKKIQEDLDCVTLEAGTDRLSWNVGTYQSTLPNIPEEQDLIWKFYFLKKIN